MVSNSTDNVRLRAVQTADLETFFAHQQDPTAVHMAAFTSKDPTDRAAFIAHWHKILADDGIVTRSIVVNGRLAGHVLSFEQFGRPEVSYWLGREFWGRGLATAALAQFLQIQTTRPLYARAAKDNVASIRVLQKCGFTICGQDKGFANGRLAEVEEYILKLEATNRDKETA